MPLLRIQSYPGIRQIFIAGEGIANLATVELFQGGRQVKMGATGEGHLAAGIARGAAVSGDLVRVITHGIVSGVEIGSGYTVNLGDRLTLAVSGKVIPLNTIQPTAVSGAIGGLVSGLTVSGWLTSGDFTASGLVLSGYATIIASGQLTGAAFNTGRVLGKALISGGSGAAIQMLVSLQ